MGGAAQLPAAPSAKRPSKLDSFKGQIVAQLERHPYTAQQVLQQLKTQGYAGGYSILKEFVRLVRPVRKPAFLMLEFAPGECAQVDWGSFGSIGRGFDPPAPELLCHGALLQPHDVSWSSPSPKEWSSSFPAIATRWSSSAVRPLK